jgi:membrane associated rhomboid family serine protease
MKELLLAVGLSSAFVAGLMVTRAGRKRASGSIPVLTLAFFSVIAAFSGIQLMIAPGLLPLLMRNRSRVGSGQPWRLATSLLVQDGGWTGAAFNLVGLLAIGTIAERTLGRLRWAAIGTTSVAAAQMFAFLWQPTGAGNSVLNFGLAGAVSAACLVMWPSRHSFIPAIVASASFALLFAARDIHGVAGATGALVELALSLPARKREP